MSNARGILTWRRYAAALGACAVALVVVALIAPLIGVELRGTSRALAWLDVRDLDDPVVYDILWLRRVPRVIAALIVGGGLAVAGCALQALLRNPLAEPFTLGVSSASSLAAVVAIRLGVAGALGGLGVGIAAVIGAALAVLLVIRLARVGAHLPAATLLLAGVTLSMFASAASMLVQFTADFTEVSQMLRWMMGGLDSVREGALWRAGVPVLFGVAVLWRYAPAFNALAAGEDAAAAVGVNVARTQNVVFAVASLTVGACIALAGPIGFVGLIVPHLLRGVLGPDHRLLLPACFCIGGVLLIVCDTVARLLLAPMGGGIPVGIVTALLGGPFFIVVLLRAKQRGDLWGSR